MFEVEKKVILTPDQEKALVEGAEFLGEKTFTDIYYDDAEFSLTSHDIWLRERSGKFELKLPMNESLETRVSDQYKEIEDEAEILAHFGVANVSLKYFFMKKGYVPFCIITTTRKKYKKEGFGIDLDVMDFGYTLAEIEYMTDDQAIISEATQAIITFAKKYGINTDTVVRGKVVEYLRTKHPAHFEALLDAKVIK